MSTLEFIIGIFCRRKYYANLQSMIQILPVSGVRVHVTTLEQDSKEFKTGGI